MLDKLLSTDTFATAQGALDGLAARQAAITDNIANVDTPGYKRKDVPFEQALRRAVHDGAAPGTSSRAPFRPQAVRDAGGIARPDGNNVDIEQEAVSLADNAVHFEALTQYVSTFFTDLKLVINGGK